MPNEPTTTRRTAGASSFYRALEQLAASAADDIDFARTVDKHTIPHWSHAWPRINELSRAGLLRVRPLNRWMAEVEAIGAACNGK